MSTAWPLVGRAAEVARLAQACEQSPGGALLVGPAGIGKSRLLAEALAACAEAGRPTVCCFASRSAASIPLAAVSAAIPDLAVDAIDPPSLLSAAERLLFEQFGPGLVLGVDDAHWLDDVSAALVFRLARRQGVTLLVAARDGEAFAADALEALWKDELLVRLDVGPLELAEVGQLLETVVGGLAADRTKREFYARSKGNPLFLRELVLDAGEHNELAAVDGVWVWSGEVHGGARLTTLIERRISGLAPNERELLELLSLFEPLPIDLAESIVDELAIERAARRDLVTLSARGQLRLGHPLYGDIIRNQLPLATRRRYVRRLAKTIERAAPRPESVLSLAALAVESGEAVSARLLVAGAEQANVRRDPSLAERLARAALAEEPTDFHARFSLGEALEGQERWAEAEETLGSLEGSEPDDASIEQLARLRARTVFFSHDADRAAAKRILTRALGRLRGAEAGAMLVATQGEFAFVEGDCAGAGAVTEPLLRAPDIDPHTRLLAAQVAGMAMAMGDAPLQAAVVADEFLPLALESADVFPRAVGWMVLVSWLGHFLAGELEAGLERCESLLGRDEHLVDALSGSLYLFIGRIELASGHAHSATLALTHAVAELRVSDPRQYLSWALSLLAAARGLAGDHAAARNALDESDRVAAQHAKHAFEADRLLAAAWVKGCRGEITGGQQLAATLGRRAVQTGMTAWAIVALHDALRLGDRSTCEQLVDLSATCEGRLAAAAGAHAKAVISGDPNELGAAAQLLADCRMHVAAAEAYADAAARSRALGRVAAANEYTARSRVFATACGGIRTPGLLAHEITSVRLTRRELEVAQLAASGATNREIATALVASTRTVEGHLLRAFAKLGISSRNELKSQLDLLVNREPSY